MDKDAFKLFDDRARAVERSFRLNNFLLSSWGVLTGSLLILLVVIWLYWFNITYKTDPFTYYLEPEKVPGLLEQREQETPQPAANQPLSTRRATDKEAIARASAAMRARKYSEGLKILSELNTKQGLSSGSGNLKGMLLAEEKRYGEALRAFNNATKLAPSDPDIHFNAAELLRRMERYGDAAERFLIVKELQRNDLASDVGRTKLVTIKWGISRIQNGEIVSLMRECEHETSKRPTPPEWHVIAAGVCLEIGNFFEASRMLGYAEKNLPPAIFTLVLLDEHFNKFALMKEMCPFYEARWGNKKPTQLSSTSE